MMTMEGRGSFELNSKTQMCGVLAKKPFGHQSNKWSKRFFVVKDGYLMYYAENERKEMDKRKMFNIHPKGVLPLGDCVIDACSEPGHIFSINIRSDDFPLNTVILAAETEWEREKWIQAIQKAKRITWSNAKLGEELIHQLENQGLSLAQEKQTYRDKFQNEAIALVDEKERREQLEIVHNELEKEKQKLEEFLENLQEEQKSLETELSETGAALKKLETDRDDTIQKSTSLAEQLTRLAEEKEDTLHRLSERDKVTRQLSEENQNLSQTTTHLNKRLSAIEHETIRLLEEKHEAEQRLQVYEERARLLEEEKVQIAEHADELQTSIKDLREQKSVTENELREEVIARLETEKRLQNAEAQLTNLDNKLRQDIDKYSENDREEMIVNVAKLKEFFENLAQEAKIDDKKPILMQTTYTARKSFIVRSKSKRYAEKRRKRVQSMKSQSDDDLFHHKSADTSSIADINTNHPEPPNGSATVPRHEKSNKSKTNEIKRQDSAKDVEEKLRKTSELGEPGPLGDSLVEKSSELKSQNGPSVERPNSGEVRMMRRSESMEKAKDHQFFSLDRRPKSEEVKAKSKSLDRRRSFEVKALTETSKDAGKNNRDSKKSKDGSESPKKSKSPKKQKSR